MSKNYNIIRKKASGGGPSYLQTFLNPFALLIGAKVPYPKSFSSVSPTNSRVGGLLFHVGALALTAAAITGAARGITYLKDKHRIENAEESGPGSIGNNAVNTFKIDMGIPGKNATEDNKNTTDYITNNTDAFSFKTFFEGTLPVAATILGSALAYKAVDSWADSRIKKILDDKVRAKDVVYKDLLKARAKAGKGSLTEEEFKRVTEAADNIAGTTKQASISSSAVMLLGLLATGTFTGALLATNKYFSETDENNIQYKAYRDGINQYIKSKSLRSPVRLDIENKEIFNVLDAKDTDSKAKDLPEYDIVDKHTPISITL